MQKTSFWLTLVCFALSFGCQGAPTSEETQVPGGPSASGSGGKPASKPDQSPAEPAIRTYSLPAGTQIAVRLVDSISTKTNKAGDTFLASLDQPLMDGDKTLFPQNTTVQGTIVSLKQPGRVKGVASIALQLVEIRPEGSSAVEIKTESFQQQGEQQKKKDALIVGGAAAVGTAIGAITGGKKGAAIGAASGGGGGAGYVLGTRGQQLEYPSESILNFRLAGPVTVKRKAS